MKPHLLLRAAWLLLGTILALTAVPAAAQTNSPDIETSIEYRFGDVLTFEAAITADQPVLRATVFFRQTASSTTDFLFAELSGDAGETAVVQLDVARYPLAPFAEITYWWQLDFSETESFTSEPATFLYRDNRSAWQFLEQDSVTVYWIEGDLRYGQAALDVARQAMQQAADEFVLPLPDELTMYLYPSTDMLRGALQMGGQSWVAGHASPELGVILLAVPPDDGIVQLERGLPHELTHILLFERMGNAYQSLPGWLNEGLAVMQEQNPDPLYALALDEALQQGAILPLESLCAEFPYDGDTAALAYAESHAFVTYLRDMYGMGGILRLLDAYQEGTTCLGGVERVFMRSLADLQLEWLNSSTSAPEETMMGKTIFAWLIVLLPAAGALITALYLRFRSR